MRSSKKKKLDQAREKKKEKRVMKAEGALDEEGRKFIKIRTDQEDDFPFSGLKFKAILDLLKS